MTSTILLILWLVTLGSFLSLKESFKDNSTVIIGNTKYKIFEVKEDKNATSKKLNLEQEDNYYMRKIKSFIQKQ
jgi:hypothetical protein